LAKIKLRIGDNEIEIDSRDFYVDNNTIRKVIEDISALLQESSARIIPYSNEYSLGESNALDSLENAEVYDPEFGEPTFVPINEPKIEPKIIHAISVTLSNKSDTMKANTGILAR